MKDLPIRKRNRLQGYDYSKNGVYFVTICAKDRHEIFSQISVGDGLARPVLTDIGKEIVNMIDYINNRYNECEIVQFVIMPNHIHLIIRIAGDGLVCPAEADIANLDGTGRASPSPTLGNIVCGLKSGVSRIVGFSPWQRSFHDHIIRNDEEYSQIAEYIHRNPTLWQEDCFYPKNLSTTS